MEGRASKHPNANQSDLAKGMVCSGEQCIKLRSNRTGRRHTGRIEGLVKLERPSEPCCLCVYGLLGHLKMIELG